MVLTSRCVCFYLLPGSLLYSDGASLARSMRSKPDQSLARQATLPGAVGEGLYVLLCPLRV